MGTGWALAAFNPIKTRPVGCANLITVYFTLPGECRLPQVSVDTTHACATLAYLVCDYSCCQSFQEKQTESRFIFNAAIKAVTVLQQQAERETHKPHINALTWTWLACGVRQQASPCRHLCSWGSLVVKTDADIVRIRAARKCKALIYTQMIQRLFHKVTNGVCVRARVRACVSVHVWWQKSICKGQKCNNVVVEIYRQIYV